MTGRRRRREPSQFQGGNVTVKAKAALLGTLTVPCTPNAPRPVADTLTVN